MDKAKTACGKPDRLDKTIHIENVAYLFAPL